MLASMRPIDRRRTPLLAVLAVAGACGGGHGGLARPDAPAVSSSPPRSLDEVTPLFLPGEQMQWDVALRGVRGAHASLAVGQPGEVDGRRVIMIRSLVESAGMVSLMLSFRDDVTSWLDLDRRRPLRVRTDTELGKLAALIECAWEGGRWRVSFQRRGGEARRMSMRPPRGTAPQDGHSSIGVLRAWTPAPGERATLWGLSGRRMWRVDLTAAGSSDLEVPLGRFRAHRLDGVATRMAFGSLNPDRTRPPRSFSVYVSDDEDRLPLLFVAATEYGDVRIEMTGYDRPAAVARGR
jgi:hypothetical protein